MPSELIVVDQIHLNTILSNMNILLEEIIIVDVNDYRYMQTNCWSITSTMRRKIRNKLEAEFTRTFEHHFPRIQRRIINELTQIVYSSVYALFKICDKYTLSPTQLKLFIFSLLRDLLSIPTRFPSFLFENANVIYTDSSEGEDDPVTH